jgi:hypothetical protein
MKRLSPALAVAAFALVACVGPGSTPSPTPSPSATPPPTATPTPTASPTPAGTVALVVTADGTVKCRLFPHGCLASMIIEPTKDWSPPSNWQPSIDDPTFGAQPDPWELDGKAPSGAPSTIAPGDYTFGIAVSEINDIANDPNRYLAAEVKCKVSLTVPADAVSVTVHFDLNRPGCDAKSLKS